MGNPWDVGGVVRYNMDGKSGLAFSVIGFGASPLGNVFGAVSHEMSSRAVSCAVDRGINVFDVSPYYGLGLAEEKLGNALVGHRSKVCVATKCGRYGADEFDFSAATITTRLEDSLRRLRTEYVDVLFAHDVEFGAEQQITDETIPAMLRLQEQGKARFLGLTGYWPGLLARLASAVKVNFVLNYCHANLFVDDMEETLSLAAANMGLGLFNASPLHMGLLGNRPVPAWHPAAPAVKRAALEVRSACERYGVEPATLGLKVCLDRPRIASTLVGLGSEEEVTAACAALDWMPPAGLMDEVATIVEPVHNLVWPSGLPKNQDRSVVTERRRDAAH